MSIWQFAYHTWNAAGQAGKHPSEGSTLQMIGLILAAKEEPDTKSSKIETIKFWTITKITN